ncbi:MAG: dihydrodipicolinate synthase family protein [Chloroflexi bacterium]|nr:dihydrodipicolinate synthase family protein [Chloroflexota bacterium]
MKEWGIMVPLVTPCTPTGELDREGLIQVSREMVHAGCHSLFVAGSTGRGPWFSREERIIMCKTVVEEAGDRVPVVAGCIAIGLDEMVENATMMADAGARAAVITAPGYFKYNQSELAKIFKEFADRCPLPVMLYDIPDFAGVKISKDVIYELAEHKNVIGFKDSTNDYDRFQELIAHFQNRNDIYLLQGKERWLFNSLKLGASGFVVSMIHIEPVLFAGLYNLTRSGNLEAAEKVQIAINQVMDLVAVMFDKRPETSTLFHFLNQSLRLRNVCDNIVMEQDGKCPGWLCDTASQAHDICKAASQELLLDKSAAR